jgi:hypothetical protein
MHDSYDSYCLVQKGKYGYGDEDDDKEKENIFLLIVSL